MPQISLLERAEMAFAQQCATVDSARGHCKSMGKVLDSYAAFHLRMFAPDTPCAERRVLVVRESFSDIVGVGHAHMGLQRFLAMGLSLGRAVVFSHCTHKGDPWQVSGRGLWKNAAAYQCDESHLIFGDHYVGHGGIDLRWSVERQELMRKCMHREVTLDLNSKQLPQFRHGSMSVVNNPHAAFGSVVLPIA